MKDNDQTLGKVVNQMETRNWPNKEYNLPDKEDVVHMYNGMLLSHKEELQIGLFVAR